MCQGREEVIYSEHLPEHFGENVFSLKAMKEFLSPKAYASIE